MGVDKFKFVSPGIFIDEIDESIMEPLPDRMGPLIIGRFQKGPGMRPVKIDSFKEFVSVFGAPSAGNPLGDIWRDSEMTAPTYAAYAAQAWLKNNQPATIYRVLGEHSKDVTAGAEAGWKTDTDFATAGTASSAGSAGGAYGLFVMPNPDSFASNYGLYAGAKNALVTTAAGGDAYSGADHTITFNISTTVGGAGTDTVILIDDSENASAGVAEVVNQIGIAPDGGDDGDLRGYLIAAINGEAHARVRYSPSGDGLAGTGVAGITASAGSNSTSVTITAEGQGVGGNNSTITLTAGAVPGLVALTALTGASGPPVTGTLAAVWYAQEGVPLLYGTGRNGSVTAANGECARLVKSSNGQWTVNLTGSDGIYKSAKFNFQKDSQNFIRKVFNTNPTLTGDVVESGQEEKYWLGETFESNLSTQLKVTGTAPNSNDQLGVILALDGTGNSNIVWGNRKQAAIASQTGWFISQDVDAATGSFNPTLSTRVHNLFKFHALDSGEHANRDYKISIMDIKPPTDSFNKYATFTVLVRSGKDADNVPVILERYSSLNLNANSLNYIGRVIGDRWYYYDEDNQVISEMGNYPNRSRYVRVEISDPVSPGNIGADGVIPFGVKGPVVPKTQTWTSGSNPSSDAWAEGKGTLPEIALTGNMAGTNVFFTAQVMTASIEFPTARLRVSSSEGSLSKGTKAFFGYQSNIVGTRRHDNTNSDLLCGAPAGHTPHALDTDKNQYSWIFTLDDLVSLETDKTHAYWVSGSRADGTSLSARSGSAYVLTGSNGGFNRLTSPMFGGFDGFDATEKDPLRNTGMANLTYLTSPALYSLGKAIDVVSDPEYVEFDVAVMPGITRSNLNTSLINMCEERGDALAIIDLYGNYEPPHEKTGTESDNVGTVSQVVLSAKDMGLNTSYGCTFYPFVQIRDTLSDSVLYVPPSVVALGTFSSSQRKSAVWFAPAGFTRGGLSEGSAGLPVLNVRQRLTSDNRDSLYEANINPIASFPAEGVVIFGQKTLQVTQSALDRINVRRLLIHVKKEISRFAATTLFEPNVQATWNSFKSRVEPFLDKVKAGFGLVDYKVILDETTTTPDLIDRNILYAKIYLKPARAIEFIALDFIITKSGASFDD